MKSSGRKKSNWQLKQLGVVGTDQLKAAVGSLLFPVWQQSDFLEKSDFWIFIGSLYLWSLPLVEVFKILY